MKTVNLEIRMYNGQDVTIENDDGTETRLEAGKNYLFTSDGSLLANQHPSTNSGYVCTQQEQDGFRRVFRGTFYIDNNAVSMGDDFNVNS